MTPLKEVDVINQLFNKKNEYIKFNITILKPDSMSYVPSFPKNYYDKIHD